MFECGMSDVQPAVLVFPAVDGESEGSGDGFDCAVEGPVSLWTAKGAEGNIAVLL